MAVSGAFVLTTPLIAGKPITCCPACVKRCPSEPRTKFPARVYSCVPFPWTTKNPSPFRATSCGFPVEGVVVPEEKLVQSRRFWCLLPPARDFRSHFHLPADKKDR